MKVMDKREKIYLKRKRLFDKIIYRLPDETAFNGNTLNGTIIDELPMWVEATPDEVKRNKKIIVNAKQAK